MEQLKKDIIKIIEKDSRLTPATIGAMLNAEEESIRQAIAQME